MFLANNEVLAKLASSKGAFKELAELFAACSAEEDELTRSLAVSSLVKPELVGAAQRQLGRSELLKELVDTFNSYL